VDLRLSCRTVQRSLSLSPRLPTAHIHATIAKYTQLKLSWCRLVDVFIVGTFHKDFVDDTKLQCLIGIHERVAVHNSFNLIQRLSCVVDVQPIQLGTETQNFLSTDLNIARLFITDE